MRAFHNIIYIIILLTIIIIERDFILSFIKYLSEPAPKRVNAPKFPKIVHLIYFPWNKAGKLKDDENNFNHDFYNKFKSDNKDWEVRLWTLSKMKSFISTNYPEYSDIWKLVKHPTQAVDFCRLLVTYEYGGIYWQYDSIQKAPLETFIPPDGKSIRLFVEILIPKTISLITGYHKIREYRPEETIRVANQVFSAYPKNDFLSYCVNKSWNNLHDLEVKSQYDILYIGANAMISEAYDEYPNRSNIYLTYSASKYIKISSNSSWHLDKY